MWIIVELVAEDEIDESDGKLIISFEFTRTFR